MEKEHIYRGTERKEERERVTPEYLDATRESVELRSRPRDPFSTVLSSSSSSVSSCIARVFSRFLSRPSAYLLRFFVVFAYGGRVIMVLYALLDPPFSFLPAKTPTSTSIISIVAFSSRSLLPFRRSFFVRFIRAKHSPRPAETPSSPTCNDKIVIFCQPPYAITGFLRIAAGRFLFLLSPP